MSKIKYFVKGFDKPFSTTEKDERTSVDIKDKPKIYFTCHPEDFDRYFEKVCCDLFKAGDCAIFFTEDMTQQFDDENREIDLERMNLFVMPVTLRLLTEPNRAMDEDFAFAEAKHIPVLPLMMESEIDAIYAKSFGKRQYLEPYSTDRTAVSYEDKLHNFFQSVFLDEETVRRIRGMFDAYIFLSYRKKDRRCANELMRLIHSDPQLERLAIWYDEFLTPTESFEENISRIMQDSRLMTLLVTPNLLEKPGGKPNFVMGKEYPAARDTGKPVLPAEMIATDTQQLKADYPGIPDAVDIHDQQQFNEVFLSALRRYASSETRDDPEHNYLIGLAYLEGIDVEIDKERGLRMITAAAEAELPEAMYRLYEMYQDGIGVEVNYNESLRWAHRLSEYCDSHFGEESEAALIARSNAAFSSEALGLYQDSVHLTEQVYLTRKEQPDSEDEDTLISLNNYAMALISDGQFEKGLLLMKKCYDKRSLLQNSEAVVHCIVNYARACYCAGNVDQAVKLGEDAYRLGCELLGSKNRITLHTLHNLGGFYIGVGNYPKAISETKKCFMLRSGVLGETHPDTLHTLFNLARAYYYYRDFPKSLEYNEQCYPLLCDSFGKRHPKTLTSAINLAILYMHVNRNDEAIKLIEQTVQDCCDFLGESHPISLSALTNRAVIYGRTGESRKSKKLLESCYALCRDRLTDKHIVTLTVRYYLAEAYIQTKDFDKALEEHKECYHLRRELIGEKHPDTVRSLAAVITQYVRKDPKQALVWGETYLNLQEKRTDSFIGTQEQVALLLLLKEFLSVSNKKRVSQVCDIVFLHSEIKEPMLLKSVQMIYEQSGKRKRAEKMKKRVQAAKSHTDRS